MSKSRSNVPVTIFFLCGSVPGKFGYANFLVQICQLYLVFIPIERFFYIYWSREATTLLKLVNGIIFYFLFFLIVVH